MKFMNEKAIKLHSSFVLKLSFTGVIIMLKSVIVPQADKRLIYFFLTKAKFVPALHSL